MENENSEVVAGVEKGQKKPRKTPEQREQEIRDNMAKMQKRLAKIEEDKKLQKQKKLDRLGKRILAKLTALGLEEVPAEVIEKLLQDNAELLMLEMQTSA